MKLTETVAKQIRTTLTNNMAAKIAALNTEYADSVVLASIKKYYLNETSRPVAAFPVIYVLESAWSFEQEGSGFKLGAYPFELHIFATDVDEENLQVRLWRYRRAVAEILNANRRVDGVWVDLALKQLGGNINLAKENQYLRNTILGVQITTKEV